MDNLQRLVDGLARRLGRAVAVDDLDFRLLAYSAHDREVDSVRAHVILTREAPKEVAAWARSLQLAKARGPVRVPANAAFALLPRVAVPVRFQGLHFGYLWLIDTEQDMSARDLELAEAAARDAGTLLFQERAADELTQERAGSLVRDLLSDDERLRVLAAAGLVEHGLFSSGQAAVVVAVRPRTQDDRRLTDDHRLALGAALRRSSGLPARECLTLLRADHGLLVVRAQTLAADRRFVEELHALVVQFLNEEAVEVLVGVGAPAEDLSAAFQSYRQALDAVRVAEVVPTYRPIAYSERLGIYRLLTQLGITGASVHELHPAVDLLRRHDPALLETLEEYLDRAGDTLAVSVALQVHRSTVYSRLDRITELTGTDLSRGDDRLALHLSLKLARLAGAM